MLTLTLFVKFLRAQELLIKHQKELAKTEQLKAEVADILKKHQRVTKQLQSFKDNKQSVLVIKKTLNEVTAENERLDKERQRAVRRLTLQP